MIHIIPRRIPVTLPEVAPDDDVVDRKAVASIVITAKGGEELAHRESQERYTVCHGLDVRISSDRTVPDKGAETVAGRVSLHDEVARCGS